MKLSQRIVNGIINADSKTLPGKIKEKLLLNLKDSLFKKEDQLIEYILNGRKILLPVSHDLPINRKIFPLYSENIGRIASYLSEYYKDLNVIDIGANVGDTVYIIKSYADVPILCIEGDRRFLSILEQNIKNFSDVFIEKSFIGDNLESRAVYTHYKGSGRIVVYEDSAEKIQFETLKKAVNKNPSFQKSKLIKIDTDGFDCRIIRSSIDFFSGFNPVIFFEYDPYFINQLRDDGLTVFDSLSEIGYDTAIFYDNTGEYLLSCGLNQKQILEDIHYYYSGRNTDRYCDICVFHKEDYNVAIDIREKELKFFSQKRNFKSSL